jgi:two-component system, response regulator
MIEKTILLVDDNENDVFLTQRALKKNNIANRVVVVEDGQEALDYLFGKEKYAGRNLNQMPVVTLLDLKMPRVDGFEVLRQIRSNPLTNHLPVVILTASKEDIDIVKSYSEGCNAYVTKPVDFDQFAEAMRQLGLFWLVLNEPPPPCRQ